MVKVNLMNKINVSRVYGIKNYDPHIERFVATYPVRLPTGNIFITRLVALNRLTTNPKTLSWSHFELYFMC